MRHVSRVKSDYQRNDVWMHHMAAQGQSKDVKKFMKALEPQRSGTVSSSEALKNEQQFKALTMPRTRRS